MSRIAPILVSLFLIGGRAFAASSDRSVPVFGNGPNGGITLSTPMQIAVFMTLLALLPAAIMSVTPFLRITIVLHFLRQALGTQTAPSNQVLVGLGLFLALAVVQPVAEDVYHKSQK